MTPARRGLHGGRMAESAGVTLVELLVGLAVLSLVFGVVGVAGMTVLGALHSETSSADQQQRARAGVHALVEDVREAGSGFVEETDTAPGQGLPAIWPDVIAAGPWAARARAHTITAWRARRDASHGRLAVPAAAGDTRLRLLRPAYCSAVSPACGFAAGDDVLVYGDHGRFGVAQVRQVLAPLDIELTAPLPEAWPAGTVVAAVVAHGYELRPDASTGLQQLVRRVGAGPASPVIDFVLGFDVEWWAAGTPAISTAPDGTEDHATAGPAPPAPGAPGDAAWPAGENCAFARPTGGAAAWRGTPGGAGAVPVPLVQFADGPWCPGPSAPSRWDADLATVVEARLSLTVAAAAAALRPAPGLGLTRSPGTRPVPDLVVRTAVRPGRRGAGG
ncbi:MAG: prepilin-type N-terminal cleavage/methylation domain-containing protein [Vicinamibacterales bacterium]